MQQNPDYWKDWRQCHPDYVERNRQRQRTRAPVQQMSLVTEPVAKMDVWDSEIPFLSGTYEIHAPVRRQDCKDGRVNEQNQWIIKRIENTGQACKERT